MPGSPYVSQFHNAQNVAISESSFNTTVNNYNSEPHYGIRLLSQAISKMAMHDSSERYPPPRCHAKSREKALEKITSFVTNTTVPRPVFWVHAPFGHGKSAVMQTAIETLKVSDCKRQFAGGFFFGRGKAGRDKAHYLLPTILYQIAFNLPETYEFVNNLITADPTIPYKSLEEQLPILFSVLRQCRALPHPPTIFIDGLDECDTPAAQRSILQMIANAIVIHGFPIRFVVASRPEAYIAEFFNKGPLSTISDFDTLEDDSEGMKQFFEEKFGEIYDSRPDVMKDVEAPWPGKKVVDELVGLACGQFLFATTVVDFVGDDYDNPLDQLRVILDSDHPRHGSAFSCMDDLYTQILNAVPIHQRERLLLILGTPIILSDYITVAGLYDFWGFSEADVMSILRPVKAIAKVENPDAPCSEAAAPFVARFTSSRIWLSHLSLEEFLMDSARAGAFWIPKEQLSNMIAERADDLLASTLSGTRVLHPTTLHRILSCDGFINFVDGGFTNLEGSYYPMFNQALNRMVSMPESRQSEIAVAIPEWITVTTHILYSLTQAARRPNVYPDVAVRIRWYLSFIGNAFQQWYNTSHPDHHSLFLLLRHFLNSRSDNYDLKRSFIGLSSILACDPQALFTTFERCRIFLDFDLGSVDASDEVFLVLIHLKSQILEDKRLVGDGLFSAFRESRLLGLSDYLDEWDSGEDAFAGHSWWEYDLEPDLPLLDADIDKYPGSTFNLIIDKIGLSLHSDLNADCALIESPTYTRTLICYLIRNYQKVKSLGPNFTPLHKRLHDLIATLISNGALTQAFHFTDNIKKDTAQMFNLYHELFSTGNPVQSEWIISSDDHASIIHYVTHEVISRMGRFCDHQNIKRLPMIRWDVHFAALLDVSATICDLFDLRRGLGELKHHDNMLDRIHPLVMGYFIEGVHTWMAKNLRPNSLLWKAILTDICQPVYYWTNVLAQEVARRLLAP